MIQPDDTNPYQSPSSNEPPPHRPKSDGSTIPKNPTTENLIVLATFEKPIDAHMFRNELANNGIDAKVANENSTTILGASIAGATSAFWIEVLILESDTKRGLEIKNEWNQSDNPDGDVIPEWLCRCGETVDAGFGVCWSCETAYDGS